MAVGQLAQGGRECEGDQEIGCRQQQILLPLEPGLGRRVLASRTVAILARVVAVADGGTARTAVDVPAHRFGATAFNRSHHRVMTGEHALAVACPIVGSIPAEDLTERAHDRPAVRWSNASVACTSALRVRWV